MSETEQALVIEKMTQLPEKERTFMMGVLAGLTAKQESKEENRETGGGEQDD